MRVSLPPGILAELWVMVRVRLVATVAEELVLVAEKVGAVKRVKEMFA